MSTLTQIHADANGPVMGDCWRTAIACLLDLDDPTEVPHFIEDHRHDDPDSTAWWESTRAFVEARRPDGTINCYRPEFPVYDGDWPSTVIATGPSPRGDFMHAVIVSARDGSLVWDPHPSRAGLAGPPVEIAALVARAAR